jgi:hypothetical protein
VDIRGIFYFSRNFLFFAGFYFSRVFIFRGFLFFAGFYFSALKISF